MFAKVAAAVTLATAYALLPVSSAQASEFGCTVLLCAASQNPSWHGVPSCVPPMTKLISMLNHGASWPTCPEGGTGKPGYEEYAACPTGWRVGYSDQGHNGNMSVPDRCEKNVCNGGFYSNKGISSFSGHDSGGNSCTQSIQRPRRSDPYYFDIMNSAKGAKERFFFNLRT